MKSFTLALLLLLVTSPVYADWNEEDVAKVVEQIKAGKGIWEKGSLGNNGQVIEIRSAGYLVYLIDVRAKLCFASSSGLVQVPCKAIKEGYPLLAPIITWEK